MFPKGFRWGVSTSAYQIEGAVAEGGRGPSIWDTFSHQPGRIDDGSTGDRACDHYHRYLGDVGLLAELGVNAYRFSIAWPRIQPNGTGPANRAGIAFYDRLVDALLAHDIDPVATLFHWDLPQALQEQGDGWFNRDTAHRFGDYAELVGAALGDRIKMWITLNEPFGHTMFGHGFGLHAPGRQRLLGALPTAHHQLLGHGLAVLALRGVCSAPVGIANNYSPVRVVGDSAADRAAGAAYHALHNRLFTDPLFGMGYPDGFELPVRDGDLEIIAAPIDVLGVNYYNPTGVAAPSMAGLPFDMVPLAGFPRTGFGLPVDPAGLGEVLGDLHRRYRVPLFVTENGCSYDETPVDPSRIAFLSGHLDAVAAAIRDGVDVRGYFVWSLLDNFEWSAGFEQRFGLVHVDFDSLVRTPRASFGWYRDLITRHRAPQPELSEPGTAGPS
jgi:beta-glucosidase